MSRLKMKKVLVIGLVISVIVNVYLLIKTNDNLNSRQNQNQSSIWAISVSGENLAKNLKEFLNYSQEAEPMEVQAKLFNSWRIVQGESRNIHYYLGAMNPQYMKEHQNKWSLLQYSLLKVDSFLHDLNMKFLDKGIYSMNNKEFLKLKTVTSVYEKIHEEVKKDSVHPELVIDLLTEEMLILDDYYPETLKKLEP